MTGQMPLARGDEVIHTVHKEKEKGAKRKRNDDDDGASSPGMGGPFPAIKVGHTGLSNTVHVLQRPIGQHDG